jgi:hypothetical protein
MDAFPLFFCISVVFLQVTAHMNFSGGKGRPARKAENLTAICEATV